MSPAAAEIATLAVVVVLAVGALALLASAAGFRPARRRRRVLVPLLSGQTLRGVLVARRLDHLELADVEVLGDRAGEVQPADGTVWVDRRNVAWVQVL